LKGAKWLAAMLIWRKPPHHFTQRCVFRVREAQNDQNISNKHTGNVWALN